MRNFRKSPKLPSSFTIPFCPTYTPNSNTVVPLYFVLESLQCNHYNTTFLLQLSSRSSREPVMYLQYTPNSNSSNDHLLLPSHPLIVSPAPTCVISTCISTSILPKFYPDSTRILPQITKNLLVISDIP